MIKTTTWKPDTCDCIIEYEWDTDTSSSERVHTIKNIIKKCDAHNNIINKTDCFDNVMDENTRKNIFIEEIKKAVPELIEEITQEDGSKKKVFKENYDCKWTFDVDRKLEIELIGFDETAKNKVENIILSDAKFLDKVNIK